MRSYLFGFCCLLAIAVFLTVFGHSTSEQVSTGQTTNTVLNVDVYYESLCSDSMRWIKDQLVPNYPALKKHLKITFIPYGKAFHTRESETGPWEFSCQHGSAECRGNKAQSCGIHVIESSAEENNRQQLLVDLIGCVMTARYPSTAVPQCSQQINLSNELRKKIVDCIDSPLSSDLLAANGDKTNALRPFLSFVPTIAINGVHTGENQNAALTNFLSLICSLLPANEKPDSCN